VAVSFIGMKFKNK